MAQPNSYYQIAKSTGIFGGVQIINVLLSIIRTKFVAVVLGASGLGIMGLFTSTIGTISSLTNLGIGFSAVRNISIACASNNNTLISSNILTMRRWVNFTGIIGALLTLILAPKLSQWTFGNDTYTQAFIWLSITLFFQAIASGQLALLQGLRKINQLAKANVAGSFFGLCFSLPLYYWLGIKGIVPALIITAVISLILSWYFARKVDVGKVRLTFRESFIDGMGMVKLGTVVMITGFASTGVVYLIQMFISRTGGIEQVGLYAASWVIVNGYVGMVFTAISTDYFPRISEVNHDNLQIRKMANEQAEMTTLLLGPIIILFLTTLPIVIRVLLTEKFLPIIGLIQWALLGVFFKAASFSISYVILAKGDTKVFFILEIVFSIMVLLTNIVFYHFFKLDGIGFASLLIYILYLVVVFAIVRVRYYFSYSTSFMKLFLTQFVLNVTAFLVVWRMGFPKAYFVGTVLLVLSSLYSYYEIRKRLDLIAIMQRIKQRVGVGG